MKQPSFVIQTCGVIFLAGLCGVSSLSAAFPAGSNSFAGAPVIPGDETKSSVTNLTAFTAEVDEPIHRPGLAATTAGNTAWWRWTAPADGYCTVDTLLTLGTTDPLQRTTIAVYTGASVGALTRVAAGGSYSYYELTPTGELSQVSFYAIQGTQYRIAVDGQSDSDIDGDSHNVVLRLRQLEARKTGRITVFAYGATLSGMGAASLEMTATGKLSGKFMLAGKSYPFAGYFGADGYFQTTMPSKVPGGFPITMLIDGTGEGIIQVAAGSETQFATVFPRKVVFSEISPNSTTGQFTGYMKHTSGTNPGGVGSLTMKVDAKGGVKGVAIAPDGTAATFSSALGEFSSPNVYYVIAYNPLLGGKAALALAIQLAETGADDRLTNGGGVYARAENSAPGVTFYPAGIFQNFNVEGGTYRKPVANSRALDFLNPTGEGLMTVINSGGELAGDVMEELTLDAKNKFIFASAVNKPSLKLNTSTGVVTGSITIPPAKKRTIKAVLTNDNFVPGIYGLVTGTTRNVAVEAEP